MPQVVPPSAINTQTMNTIINSLPLLRLDSAVKPALNAPVLLITPIKPPSTKINAITSAPSIVPRTMLSAMSPKPLGCCGTR